MPTLSLTKHEGLGNDFLVLVDMEGRQTVDEGLARELCDRHRGIGADGIVRVTAGRDGTDVTMELRNADGGTAEVSGNGLRCLAQAVVRAGVVTGPELVVGTLAGPRRLTVEPGPEPTEVVVRVEMGRAEVGPTQQADPPAQRACWVDMGNPHLVLLGPDPDGLDVPALGAAIEAHHAGGVNVEFVAPGPNADELRIRVWERGVGETLACGSGACAAAAAAHQWDLVGPSVLVRQRGGPARVDLGADTIVLTGPARYIARVEVDV